MSREMVIIANLGAPNGVRGWVKVFSYTEPAGNLIEYKNWYIQKPGQDWQQIAIESIRPHGNAFVVKFVGIDDRDAAALLTHCKIAVQREELPELDAEDQHYWTDLLGLAVTNQDQVYLGEVVDFFETGANDVLVVKDQERKKEHLIPVIPDEYIVDINLDAQQMEVCWDAEF